MWVHRIRSPFYSVKGYPKSRKTLPRLGANKCGLWSMCRQHKCQHGSVSASTGKTQQQGTVDVHKLAEHKSMQGSVSASRGKRQKQGF